jgi:ribosomal protein S18 acetylase RimI-like enzyme
MKQLNNDKTVLSYCDVDDLKHIPLIDVATYGEAFYNYIVARQLWDIHKNHFFVVRRGLMSVQGYSLGAIDTNGDGWLMSVAVYPFDQNRGYGTLLAHQVLRSLFDRGVEKIKLTVSPNNHRASNIYKIMGFNKEGIHPDPKYFGNVIGSRFVMSLEKRNYQCESAELERCVDGPLPFPIPN